MVYRLMFAVVTFSVVCLMCFSIAKCAGVQMGTIWAGYAALCACSFGSLFGYLVFNGLGGSD